jgi:hypothetical protein
MTRLVHGGAALVLNAEKLRHLLHLASEAYTLGVPQEWVVVSYQNPNST